MDHKVLIVIGLQIVANIFMTLVRNYKQNIITRYVSDICKISRRKHQYENRRFFAQKL